MLNLSRIKTIGITSVSLSRNSRLIQKLKSKTKCKVIVNNKGRKLKKFELLNFLKNCDYAIIGLDKIEKNLLLECKKLKGISKFGVGIDNIDFDACKKLKIKVKYSKGVNKRSVSEEVLSLMISLIRNLFVSGNNLKNFKWIVNGGTELSGKTIGIIGVGNVGKDLIKLLKPFKCKILVNDILNQKKYYDKNKLIKATKKNIFMKSDIITIHTPLSNKTYKMVNYERLKLMKKTSFLINTSRGKIIDQKNLKSFLIRNKIAGAALDVYEEEPPNDREFLKLPNLICMPHIGGSSREALNNMGLAAINNLIKIIK
tara:strand:+ start:4060 stop:5001 length:942 start_codon:yes stop_codon:yes gene_type:complete